MTVGGRVEGSALALVPAASAISDGAQTTRVTNTRGHVCERAPLSPESSRASGALVGGGCGHDDFGHNAMGHRRGRGKVKEL